MKTPVTIATAIVLILIIPLSLALPLCKRYVQSVTDAIEQRVNDIEPGLCDKTLPPDQIRQLLEPYPEVKILLGDRLDRWQQSAEQISIAVVLDSAENLILHRIKRIIRIAQLAIITLAAISVAAYSAMKKERVAGESTRGVRFGDDA